MTGEMMQQRARASVSGLGPSAAQANGLRVMLDASALLKRYASEAGHARVLDLFAQADGLLVAAHCQSEVAAALLRRRRDGCLPEAEFDRVWAAVQRDIADMVRVPLDDHVERFAFAAMEHEPPGRSQGESRSAQHGGSSSEPPGRSQGEFRSAQHPGYSSAPLRVSDALHVGSALAAQVDLFVTADQRLAQVARLLGLPAECLEAAAASGQEESLQP
jgi:hypothetical protein